MGDDVPVPRPPRRILLLDCDQFFVQCARLADPEGAGRERLLLVGGSPSGRGVVTSASYETRVFGVHSGMPTAVALRLCPRARVVAVPRRICGEKSRAVRAVLARFSPLVEAASIDEAYIDLSGTERLYAGESLHDTAVRIQQAVLRETEIQTSVGGGTCKLVAKLAVERAKPAGVRVVPPGGEQAFLATFKLGEIPGVGPVFTEELRRFGLVLVADVQGMSERAVVELLGEGRGEWLYRRAHGRDDGRIEPEHTPKSISRDETFPRDLHRLSDLERELLVLSARLGADLRDAGFRARTITLRIRDADFRTRQASRTATEALETDRAIHQLARGAAEEAARLAGGSVRACWAWRPSGLVPAGAPRPSWHFSVRSARWRASGTAGWTVLPMRSGSGSVVTPRARRPLSPSHGPFPRDESRLGAARYSGESSMSERAGGFRLWKYYLDCVGADGTACIGVRGRPAPGDRSHCAMPPLLECAPDGTRRERHTYRRVPEPVGSGAGIDWECEPLGVSAQLAGAGARARGDPAEQRGGPGRLASARAARRCAASTGRQPPRWSGGATSNGWSSTIEPWRLPLDTLYWGRFHSAHGRAGVDRLGGPVRLRHVLHNGELLADASFDDQVLRFEPGLELQLEVTRTIHDAPVVAAIERLPRVLRRVPPSFMAAREVKWLSQARLSSVGRVPASGLGAARAGAIPLSAASGPLPYGGLFVMVLPLALVAWAAQCAGLESLPRPAELAGRWQPRCWAGSRSGRRASRTSCAGRRSADERLPAVPVREHAAHTAGCGTRSTAVSCCRRRAGADHRLARRVSGWYCRCSRWR